VGEREIRRMQPHELEEVVRMWRRSRDDVQPWLEARMRHSAADDLAFFRDVVARECEVWLAVEGRAPLGLLALHDGFIEQLYVDPRAQRNGVGRALLEKARALFPRGLALYTHQRNARARAFYERFGFRPVRFGVSGPPECEPDVRYAFGLHPPS
jgi:ribosomal protein S18 acetylase RimI-like enzyme